MVTSQVTSVLARLAAVESSPLAFVQYELPMPDAPHRLHLSDLSSLRLFRRRLLRWYRLHKRDLPWRADRDPYRVWLAEIMLQQTRVAAVVEHYQRFLRRFPTLEALASARSSSVLAAWSGLGYYRRARALHEAAKKVVNDHSSNIPATAEQLRTLPGVGRYTAAAIASIAFQEPVAVVDGNVERVLRRIFGKDLPGEKVWSAAEKLLSRTDPGDFNQAMMELGATVCLPRQPQCLVCPVFPLCCTRGEGARPEAEVRRRRAVQYELDLRDGAVLLVQRPRDSSLMPGMWELPETHSSDGVPWLSLRHSITVTDYLVKVTRASASNTARGRWVRSSRLTTLPLTGLTRKILRAAQLI